MQQYLKRSSQKGLTDTRGFGEHVEWEDEGKGSGGVVVKESEEVREGAAYCHGWQEAMLTNGAM